MNLENNKIVRSGFSSVLQIIASSISYVIIYSFIIFKLGKVQLGIWAIITSIPAAISFLGSGVAGSILRFIPVYIAKKQDQQISKIIFNGLIFNLLLGSFIVIIAYCLTNPILKFMFGLSEVPVFYKELFYISLITFLITFISAVTLATLDGLQKIVAKNIILISSSLIFCIAAVAMIFNYNLKGLFYAQLLQAMIAFLFSLVIIYRSKSFNFKYGRFDAEILKLFYRYGGKLQFISILNILFEPVTKFFLNRYFGLGVVGVYDLVNRIVSQLRMLVINAVQVIVPFVAKEVDERSAVVKQIYEKSFKGTVLLSSILFGLLLTFSFSIIYFFNQLEVREFQIILLYLTLASVTNILSAPAYMIRLATGKFKYLILAQLLSTGINILLFIFLGLYPDILFVLLPTTIAICLSSIYVIFTYQRNLSSKIYWTKSDISISVLSILFPVLCILVAKFYFSVAILVSIALVYFILLIFNIYKNEYLMNVIHILIGNKNKTEIN